MPDIELQRMIAAQEFSKYLFSKFPCHTLAVEKCDELVTEAFAGVCCVNTGGGFIRTQINNEYGNSKFS